jgi:hypothetical protein
MEPVRRPRRPSGGTQRPQRPAGDAHRTTVKSLEATPSDERLIGVMRATTADVRAQGIVAD